jgi:hypothetical protein
MHRSDLIHEPKYSQSPNSPNHAGEEDTEGAWKIWNNQITMQLLILRSQLSLRKVDLRDLVNTASQERGYDIKSLTGLD